MQNYNCWNKIVARDPRFVVNLTAPQHDLQKRLLSRTGGRSDDNIATIQKRFKVRPILSSDASLLLPPFHCDSMFYDYTCSWGKQVSHCHCYCHCQCHCQFFGEPGHGQYLGFALLRIVGVHVECSLVRVSWEVQLRRMQPHFSPAYISLYSWNSGFRRYSDGYNRNRYIRKHGTKPPQVAAL